MVRLSADAVRGTWKEACDGWHFPNRPAFRVITERMPPCVRPQGARQLQSRSYLGMQKPPPKKVRFCHVFFCGRAGRRKCLPFSVVLPIQSVMQRLGPVFRHFPRYIHIPCCISCKCPCSPIFPENSPGRRCPTPIFTPYMGTNRPRTELLLKSSSRYTPRPGDLTREPCLGGVPLILARRCTPGIRPASRRIRRSPRTRLPGNIPAPPRRSRRTPRPAPARTPAR